MKKLIPMLCLLLACQSAHAQAPESFNYQAVIRDLAGNPLASQAVVVKFSILADSTNGTALYAELHNAQTDNLGMFSLQVGKGFALSGSFSDIPWARGDRFLKVEANDDGSLVFRLLGTSQLLSVPYALHASSIPNVTVDDHQITVANGLDSTLLSGDFKTGVVKVRRLEASAIQFPDGSTINSGGVPKGAIVMWSGTEAPEGWALCNGENNTPNLQGRFVVGYNPADSAYDQPGNLSVGDTIPGETGGMARVALTIAEMPNHNHGNRVLNGEANTSSTINTFPAGFNIIGIRPGPRSGFRHTGANHVNFNEITGNGGGQSHENRPPYYVLAYIIKL